MCIISHDQTFRHHITATKRVVIVLFGYNSGNRVNGWALSWNARWTLRYSGGGEIGEKGKLVGEWIK